MGYKPSVQSKGFGRQAMLGAGAVAGMALGYGLGSFPRPHFHFHSPQEEYYYNHYMYQHYGYQDSRGTSAGSSSGSEGRHAISDSSMDNYGDSSYPPVLLKPPPKTYDDYMNSCMQRKDLLLSERTGGQTQPRGKTQAGAPSATKPSEERKKGGERENETAMKGAGNKEDRDEVVSIMDVGYPALIQQLKARECLERYMKDIQRVAKKQWQDAYGLEVNMLPADLISSWTSTAQQLICLELCKCLVRQTNDTEAGSPSGNMKHAVVVVLCMALLVEVYTKGRGSGSGRSSGSSKGSSSSSSSSSSSKGTSSSSSSGGKTGSSSKTTVHSKPHQPVHGGGWGTHNPTRNVPNNHGINWNPNNNIMSPRYGGNFAYGPYGYRHAQGDSQFAKSVKGYGYGPSDKSKGFGRQGMVAVGAGAMAGMALGYGLGSYPRPNVQFQSPQQEYYYNHYMYQHHGSQDSRGTNQRTHISGESSPGSRSHHGSRDSSSTSDTNSYAGDDRPPLVLLEPETYDAFMRSCIKRRDLLQPEHTANQTQSQNKTKVGTPSTTPVPDNSTKPSEGMTKGEGRENETVMKGAKKEEDRDEVVSILDIGYPALIEQLKFRQCLELYMNAEAKKQRQNAYGHGVKVLPMDLISSSLLCLVGFLLLY
ncbi:hypothetical protein ACEWY4_012376 [Coilia grayii]|uniref:Prion protein n=1 Tax=Coilia grayii TaxID=363190 RepID=A0ABD1K0D7_9TELE